MKKQQKKTRQGFTIIEVVLVLAIAGLIFLMVFVALPSLQRSQRDTQRRDHYALLATTVTNYQTNNNGKLPTASTFWTRYISADDFQEPGGNGLADGDNAGAYDVIIKSRTDMGSTTPNAGQVYIVTGGQCDGENLSSTSAGSRYFAIYGYLESGAYCQDNQ